MGILFALAQHRYVSNFVLGPFDVGQSDLDSLGDPTTAPRYFVKVSGAKAIDTGIEQLTIHKRSGVETSRSVSAKHYALVVGTRLLVVKSSGGTPTTAEGELIPMSLELQGQLFNAPSMDAIRGRFYPYVLSDTAFRVPCYLALVGALLLGLAFVKYGLPACKYIQDPGSHPVVKRVSSWGDPLGIALDAKREASSPRYKGGGWMVTGKYLIQSTVFTFDLLRMSDLLWAYKHVTKHSINLIPTGKTYAAILRCYGGTAKIDGREKEVHAVLAFATERAPWAVFGFSEELAKLFRNRTQEFCSAVDQKKREWMRQTSTQG
jgi:hypothetical protein